MIGALPPAGEVRTVCPYCGVGCGVIATVRRGRMVGVRGDPEHPTNRGGLCAKGQRLAETLRPGDRVLRPMRRPSESEGRFDRRAALVPDTWEAVLADCARRIRHIQARHGRDSMAFYLSGQLQTEDYYVANKLVKGFLGTNNVDTNSRLCMASAAAAYKRAFGSDAPAGCYEDLDHARCVLFIGSNAAQTHPILFGRLLQARRRLGARWIVVDPRRTVTAEAADLHLPIVPGTDVALLNAMLITCVEGGFVDRLFVRRHTAGFDEAVAAARGWTAERAAGVCDVPADAIRAAARLVGGSAATLSLWCQGINQSTAGTDKGLALINLHLAAGQLGRPGAGPFSLTGQANAMGGREVGGMATELAAHRLLASASDRAEVSAFWGSGPIDPTPGITAVELVDALQDGRVRGLWIAGTNPLASLPDGGRAEAALARAEMVVVQELFHPTDTSVLADVLLPAAGWAEKTGTLTSSERRVALAEAAVAPPGEARPDWRIFADLAAHLGHGAAFDYRSASDVFDEHTALTAGRTCDMAGLDHERLRREPGVQWPVPARGHPGTLRRYPGLRFATPDGRARLHPVVFRPPIERPDDEHPLRLVTMRDPDAWHTLTRTGRIAELRSGHSDAHLLVNPADGRTAGLEDGDAVRVTGRRGRWHGRVRLDPGVRRGTVMTTFHTTPLWNRASWINRLTSPELDPDSRQPELKHAVVRIEPAPGNDGAGLLVVGGTAAADLAAALRRQGTQDVALAGWDAPPPSDRPICAVVDGSAGWLDFARRARIPRPPIVDAGARLAGRDGVLVVGSGVRTTCGLGADGDPQRLAAAILDGGRRGPRALAPRRITVTGRGRAELYAGDPDAAPDDAEQGIELLVVRDDTRGVVVRWRLGSGQVLGVSAHGTAAVVEAVALAWDRDPAPDRIRAAPMS